MAEQRSLEAINQGVETWNRLVAPYSDLSNADLRGRSLARATFILTTLKGADLRGSTLTDASFQGANLSNALLQESILVGAEFQGTKEEATSVGNVIVTIPIAGADLHNAHLERADLSGAVFGGPGRGANLHGAYLREAVLRDCDLSGVRGGLRPEQLAGADLTGAKLSYRMP